MEKRSSRTRESKTLAVGETSRSLKIGRKGIRTGRDFADFMSGLMSDLVEGKVPPQIGNATCNAGGKLLKVVEMQYKYGRPSSTSNQGRELLLTV